MQSRENLNLHSCRAKRPDEVDKDIDSWLSPTEKGWCHFVREAGGRGKGGGLLDHPNSNSLKVNVSEAEFLFSPWSNIVVVVGFRAKKGASSPSSTVIVDNKDLISCMHSWTCVCVCACVCRDLLLYYSYSWNHARFSSAQGCIPRKIEAFFPIQPSVMPSQEV